MTTQFSGLVMAYESQSEEAFLTTQQVDEARHVQHLTRFCDQVLAVSDEINEFAFFALSRRLKVIGVGLGAPAV